MKLIFAPIMVLVALSAISQIESLPAPTIGLLSYGLPLGLPVQDHGDAYVIDVPVPANLVAGGDVLALPLVESLLLANAGLAAPPALPANLVLTLTGAALAPYY
ncbi:uncharacterized protein LOC129941509 [Eupeodes corollae]|uniref:uncharacterized protein LOC129941509 n=1 Tax=Eupeodes corollae TaxID=290404 RepID=UPI00248F8045|nr:uncharacterized protein LOC129941509 [Eupeodes corollae]